MITRLGRNVFENIKITSCAGSFSHPVTNIASARAVDLTGQNILRLEHNHYSGLLAIEHYNISARLMLADVLDLQGKNHLAEVERTISAAYGLILHKAYKISEGLCLVWGARDINSGTVLGFSRAVVDFSYLCSINPLTDFGYLFLGHSYYGLGYFEKASAAYRKHLDIRPDDTDVYLNLGDSYQLFGKFDDSVESYRKFKEYRPGSIDGCLAIGMLFMQHNDVTNAIKEFTQALEIDPDSDVLQAILGELYIRINDQENAKACLEFAISGSCQLDGPYISLANLYYQEGNSEKALKIINQLLAMNAFHPEGCFFKARFLADLSFDMQAEKLLESSRRLGVAQSCIDKDMASIQADRGLFSLAEKSIRASLASDPNDRNALVFLAFMLVRLEKYEDAKAVINDLVENNSNERLYHSWLGSLYSLIGDLEKAALHYEIELANYPENQSDHYELAVIYHGQNKLQQAYQHYLAAGDYEDSRQTARDLFKLINR